MNNTTNALIYCRVSSERQVKEGHGLDSQEQRGKTYATQKGYKVEAIFKDEGISGATFDRPGIQKLFDYIVNHPFQKYVVIVDDTSRIARDVRVHGLIREQLRKCDADLLSPNFNFEDSPEGELGENIVASFNQYSRKANRRQVMQKQKARLESGHWSFCNPPGLKYINDPIHGKLLIPNEPLASIFKEAIELFAQRVLLTPDEVRLFIAEKYKDNGIPRKISLNGANHILREPLYAGLLEYKPWDVPLRKAQHQGFISEETYTTVQNIFVERSRPKSRKDTSLEFPIRNLFLCCLCGKPMTASFNTGKYNKRYPNYYCKTDGCPLKNRVIHRKQIHDDFEKILQIKELSQEFIDLALAVLNDVWSQMYDETMQIQTLKQKELSEVNSAIQNLADLISKTNIPELTHVYEGKILSLANKKKELEAVSGTPKYTQEEFRTATETVLTALKDPVSMWKSDKLEDKHFVYHLYFETKPYYDWISGFRNQTLASLIKLMEEFSSSKNNLVEMPGIEPGSE